MEELCIMFDSQSNKLPMKFPRSQAVADEGQQRLRVVHHVEPWIVTVLHLKTTLYNDSLLSVSDTDIRPTGIHRSQSITETHAQA